MASVFISYNRQSATFTQSLADDITALGHRVWFDQEISGGQAWWDRILARIRQAEIVVFVLSAGALDSVACKREYEYAAQLGKPILPILASGDISTNLLPPALSQIQFVDYRKHDREAAFRLARAITTLPRITALPDPLPAPPEAPISYLGSLAEQVATTSILSREQQSALVLDLKRMVQDPGVANDALLLLAKFRQRRDLLAHIAEEIDALRRLAPPGSGTITSPVAPPDGTSRSESAPEVITNAADGYALVLIPGGRLMMGSPKGEEGRYDDEGPQHEVQVPSFYLGRYPVTNDQYQKFLEANPDIQQPAFWADRDFNQPQQPVVGVSWEDAQAHAHWAGLRLPTEAEWEYACRAGAATRFYTGDEEKDLNRAGWYCGNSDGRLQPVGEKITNPFGLYDMHGNVWEWVEDDYHDYYQGAPDDGRAWIDNPRGPYRVVRGGSWFNNAGYCRSATRDRSEPGDRVYFVGFRLSRSVSLGH